ncbi:MAG: NAD(P)/FAD-dependent oxidoreductase, partial [Bacillota bacterium]|nr:NAD(P)/FAD-dependent oxidoreductase [Bacillota bacterium]
RFGYQKTEDPKKVLVIGGGPGGMEAARAAAVKGHKVTLYEKDSALGGQLKSAATPDFKSQLRELVFWYIRQLELLRVKVKLNSGITADSPELKSADAIIIAAGAVPFTPDIKGIENTIDIISAHAEPDKLMGKRIVYCGGGLSACDSALETALKGKKTAIIEMMDEIAPNDHFINKAALLPMLKKNGAEIYTGHTVLEIQANGVRTQKKDGTEEFIPADTVVSAFGMKPNDAKAREIDALYHYKTRIVGDCLKVGKVGSAVREGFFAGVTIE